MSIDTVLEGQGPCNYQEEELIVGGFCEECRVDAVFEFAGFDMEASTYKVIAQDAYVVCLFVHKKCEGSQQFIYDMIKGRIL